MIAKLAAVGLIAAFTGMLLSEMGCKAKRAVTALTVVIILLGLLGELGGIFGELISFADEGGVGEAARCALKTVGLGYVFGISADISDELGEKSISGMLTLLGRIEIFVVVLPFIKEMIEMGLRLIK